MSPSESALVNPRGRATVTLLGFGALAAATSLLVGWLGGDGSLREWLLSCAGALELWGVLLVASPELAPVMRRLEATLIALWGATTVLARRTTDWVRVKMGRPRHRVVSLSGAISGGGAMRARATKGVREGATDKEKIDFLLRRDRETQDRLDEIQEQLDDLPERWRGDIEATAGTLRQEQEQGLAELRDEQLTARLGGVVLLVVGLALATWGNLA